MPVNRGVIAAAAAAGIVVLGAGGAYFWKNQHDIRNADFRNGPVEIFGTACADPDLTSAAVTTIPLHDGTYQLGKYQFELVGDVKYGDVSGQTNQDSGDKAVFVGSCNSGGTVSQVLFVYGMQDGKLTRLATADLSNGGANVVQSYAIGNGAIQIHENQGTPPQLVTVSYALLGGQLQNVGGNGTSPAPTQVASNADTATNATDTNASDDANDTSGDDKISFQYFHDQLSPYGEWVDHPRWGQVWRPNAENADFRPYKDGHWENTDEYGMTWVSNTDWGDIAYHYGRWAYDPSPQYHWIWVPDYTWAPSWVVWRAGDGYVGWMPMPPGDYDGEGEYADDWADWYGYRGWYADMAADSFYGLWSVVPVVDLFAPSVAVYDVRPAVFGRFIGRLHGWTRYGVSRGHIVDRSFEPRRFAAAFHRQLPVSHGHNLFHHSVPKTSARGGSRIAAHEHQAGHGTRVGLRDGIGRNGSRRGTGLHAGFDRHGVAAEHRFGHDATRGIARGYGRGSPPGFSRSGRFAGQGGFSRSGTGGSVRSGQGFGRSGSGYARSQGLARSDGYVGGYGRAGSSGASARSGAGYARSGTGVQGGYARSGGGYGGGFAAGNRGGYGGGFGGGNGGALGGNRALGGASVFNMQRASSPRSGGNGGGNSGGGNRRHGH